MIMSTLSDQTNPKKVIICPKKVIQNPKKGIINPKKVIAFFVIA